MTPLVRMGVTQRVLDLAQRAGRDTEAMTSRAVRSRPVAVTVTCNHPPVSPAASAPAGAPAPNGAPAGLSPLAAKVLDQLSITAWLPAALLIANTYLVGGMFLVRDHAKGADVANLKEVVAALNDKALGVIVAVVLGIVLATLVTQSLEFAAIRFLEGYWGGSVATALPTKAGVAWQLSSKRRMRLRADRIDDKAFHAAERGIARTYREDPDLAQAIVRHGSLKAASRPKSRPMRVWDWCRNVRVSAAGPDVVPLTTDAGDRAGSTESEDPEALARAAKVKREAKVYYDSKRWRRFVPAHLRHRALSLDNRIEQGFPDDPSRMMPTRLGNALRNSEEQLRGEVAGSAMRSYLYDHLDDIGPQLMVQHNQYRNRLDMCAVLTVLTALLAVLDAVTLPMLLPLGFTFGTCGGLLVLSALSYRGAIAAAMDYGPTLLAINTRIENQGPAQSAA